MKRTRILSALLAALLLMGSCGLAQTALAAGAPAASSRSSSVSYQAEVTASSLNIRKGAGTGYGVVGTLRRGDTCTVVEERRDSRGITWGYLGDGRGWVCL